MKVSSLFFNLIIAGKSLAYQQIFGDIFKAPTLFKEWIATERLISKESSNWQIEKASLYELLELKEDEFQAIDDKLNSVEKENSAGKEELIKLADENEDLKAAILPVSETLKNWNLKFFISSRGSPLTCKMIYKVSSFEFPKKIKNRC